MFMDQCQKVNPFFWTDISLLIGTTCPCQKILDVEKTFKNKQTPQQQLNHTFTSSFSLCHSGHFPLPDTNTPHQWDNDQKAL